MVSDIDVPTQFNANFEVQVGGGDAILADFSGSREDFEEQSKLVNLAAVGNGDFMERDKVDNSLKAILNCLENPRADMALNTLLFLSKAHGFNGFVQNSIDKEFSFPSCDSRLLSQGKIRNQTQN